MQKPTSVRQGDLLFVPVRPKDKYQLREDENNGFRKDGVIQEGEATGHHHSIDPTMGKVYRPAFGRPFVVTGDKPVNVLHGGSTQADDRFHAPRRLEPNTTYDVHIAREDDGRGNARQVTD
jgi:hypothetical protein